MAPEFVAWQVLVAAALFAMLAVAGAAFSPEPWTRRLGLLRGRLGGADIARSILGLLGLSHAADAALSLVGWRANSALAELDQALAGLGPADLILPLLALSLGAALAEELFFRGLIQRGLARRVGTPAAIALTAVAFGALHGEVAHGVAAFCLGLYLGALAARADSIRVCMAAHAVNNAIAVLEMASGWRIPGGEVPILLGGLAVALWGLRGGRHPADP